MADELLPGIEIHDGIMALVRAVENDRIQIHSVDTLNAMRKVVFGRDGKIDPSSVGPEVRAVARAYIAAHPDDWATR